MPMSAEDFIGSKLRINVHPANIVALARGYSDEFAEAVSAALEKNSPSKRPQSMRQVVAETQTFRKKRMKQMGVEPVRIPNKEQRMQEAISALVGHVDEGRKPSALNAASQPGLDRQQSKKLAYGVPVKRDAVQAVVDLSLDSPFVHRLLGDAGMTGLVVNGHVSLSKLAGVLTNVHRSLAERVQQLEAAVIVLAGEQQRQREVLAAHGNTGNSRGAWHARALALREQGKTGNQIARLLGKSTNAVEKVLSRKVPACEGVVATPSGQAASLH